MDQGAPSVLQSQDWWPQRVCALECRVADLKEQLRAKEATLKKLSEGAAVEVSSRQDLEAARRTQKREEAELQEQVEDWHAEVAAAVAGNESLEQQKTKLLRELKGHNLRLGETICTASNEAATAVDCLREKESTSRRNEALRSSLRGLGDVQSALSAEAEAERSRRHKLREQVQNALESKASQEEEMRKQIQQGKEGIQKIKDNIKLSEEAQKVALTEMAEIKNRVAIGARYASERDIDRDEVHRQVKELARIHEKLREDLEQLQAKLWKKEQKEIEAGRRPWADAGEIAHRTN